MEVKHDVIVVGGAGYLGQGVVRALRQMGRKPYVIDCLALQDGHGTDIRDCDPQGFEPTDVIWLATLHDVRGAPESRWSQVFSEVMTNLPIDWLRAGHSLTYVSSTRATTHPETLYGFTKKNTEYCLIDSDLANWRVVRPGTVYGGFAQVDSPAMRIHTVINRLACGLKTEVLDEIPFYYVHYNRVCYEIARRLKEPHYRTITNCIDGKIRACDLRSSNPVAFPWITFNAEQIDADRAKDDGRLDLDSPHPMLKYREYYGV